MDRRGPRALIPGSCRFPQIDSLLTFFFFSAAGSAAWIDGAASPSPLSRFLSLLLISAPINQGPPLPPRPSASSPP